MNFTITPKHLLTQLPCAGAWGRLRENSQEDLATPRGVVWALTRRVAIDPHPVVDGPGAEGHPAQAAEDVTVPLSLQRQPCALRTHRGHV